MIVATNQLGGAAGGFSSNSKRQDITTVKPTVLSVQSYSSYVSPSTAIQAAPI